MKFNFLKFKKQGPPSLLSLQPKVFNTDLFWFTSLGLFLFVFMITGFIGFKFFYSQYFESYKESVSIEDFENIMSISKLKNAIERRDNFIKQEISFTRDPSL
jgi:hypothetical protein